MKKSLVTVLAIATATLLMTSCDSRNVNYPDDTELPVSRVVMYQSGIGYVERTAVVSDDELVLRIRPDQINDILKSLTVIDRGNGRPVSISLPVDKDTLNRLSNIPDQVTEGGIRSLLYAFRGANVQIKTRGSRYEGRIVGVDESDEKHELNVSLNNENKSAVWGSVTLMTKNNVLEVIPLQDIRSVALFDKSLADGLDKSLDISLSEGDWKQVELRIRMDSAKERELALSYLVAMPTWKPAYRLVIGDDNKGILQGWAVISNVTGADWNNISFSLVSGQPMSFTYDLYKPHFLTRPDLSGLATQTASAPEIIGSGFGSAGGAGYASLGNKKAAAKPKAMKEMARAQRAMDFEADEMMFDMAEEEEPYEEDEAEHEYKPITANEISNSFTEIASKAQIGSFDEYKLASKLTVPDGNTALVNLIQSQLTARDTRLIKADDVYNFDQFYKGWRKDKSYQTIEMQNNSGVALDSGPITIFRDSAIIGEGYLSRTENDATAYITFANESRMSVTLKDSVSERKLRLESVQNGQCSYVTETTLTQKFAFESHIGNETTALLQLRRFDPWTPVNFPENTVKTDSNYVFSIPVPANGEKELALSMKRDNRASRYISGTRRNISNLGECKESIQNALSDNAIPSQNAADFKQFISDLNELETIEVKTNSLNQRRSDIQNDQSSLTQTLVGLKDIKTSNANALKDQLMERQKNNEKALVDITTELYNLQIQKGEIELRMKTYERSLAYNRK